MASIAGLPCLAAWANAAKRRGTLLPLDSLTSRTGCNPRLLYGTGGLPGWLSLRNARTGCNPRLLTGPVDCLGGSAFVTPGLVQPAAAARDRSAQPS